MNIEEYLDKYNLTQQEFADQVGLARSSINGYIQGRRFPDRFARLVLVEKTSGEITEKALRDYHTHAKIKWS